MKRGRPLGSPVRQNIIELLFQFGELHWYDICKHYHIFKVAKVEKHASVQKQKSLYIS